MSYGNMGQLLRACRLGLRGGGRDCGFLPCHAGKLSAAPVEGKPGVRRSRPPVASRSAKLSLGIRGAGRYLPETMGRIISSVTISNYLEPDTTMALSQ